MIAEYSAETYHVTDPPDISKNIKNIKIVVVKKTKTYKLYKIDRRRHRNLIKKKLLLSFVPAFIVYDD